MANWKEFSAQIKEKYPQYKDIDDVKLTKAMLEKYPQYKAQVDLSGMDQPQAKPQVNKAQDFLQDVPIAKPILKEASGLMQSPAGTLLSALGTAADYILPAPMRAGLSEVAKQQEIATKGPQQSVGQAIYGAVAKPIMAGLGQYFKKPSEAPTGQQVSAQFNVPKTTISEILPSLYSKTGEGLRLKEGSYLDPSIRGIVGTGIDLADPSIAVGGFAPKTLLKGGAELGFMAGKKGSKVAGEAIKGTALGEKVAQAKSFVGPSIEKISSITKVVTGSDVKPAADLDKYVSLGKQVGLKADELPATVWAGKDSPTARIEKTMAEGAGPFSTELTNKYKNAHEKLKTAIDKHVERVAGTKLKPIADISDEINQSILKNIETKKKSIETTYSTALKDGDIWIRPEDKQKLFQDIDWVKQRGELLLQGSGAQEKQGREILKILDKIDKSSDSYDKILKQMRLIGEEAWDGKELFTEPEKRSLYNALSKTLYKSIDDSKLKKKIEADNKIWEDVLSKEEKIKNKLGKTNLSSEQALRGLFETGNKNDIEALKTFIDDKQLKQIKGAYLSEISRPIEQSAGKGGFAGYESTLNKLNNPKKYGVLSVLFDEKDLNPLKNYLDFGERMGAPIMSKSGTGPSNVINEATKKPFVERMMESVPQGFERRSLTAAQQKMEKISKGKYKAPLGIAEQLQELRVKPSSILKKPGVKVGLQQLGRQYNLSQQNQEQR